jgi:GTP 3',8-cyclase
VLDGLHKAIEIGLTPVRLNCVVMRERNLSQVTALAEMTRRLPVSVRFIEYCPTSRVTGPVDDYVPNAEVRQIIESQVGPLSAWQGLVSRASRPRSEGGTPSAQQGQDGLATIGGPAVYFKAQGAAGAIGFISGRSSVFCPDCSRLRLTSDGKVKPCLHADRHYDVRGLLRGGVGDEAIRGLIRRVLREKGRYTRVTSTAEDFLMQSIGG